MATELIAPAQPGTNTVRADRVVDRIDVTRPISRRQALTGIGLAGAAGMLPIAAAAVAQAQSVDRSAWDWAVATYKAAKEASERHWNKVEEPAYARMNAAAPRPSFSFVVKAKNGQEATYYVSPDDDFATVPFRPFTEHADRIREEWKRFRRVREVLGKRLKIDAINAESDRLGEVLSQAEDRLMALPPPDTEALAFKIKIALDDDREADVFTTAILADAKRILGEA